MTGVLTKKRGHMDTEAMMPCEDRGRDCSDANPGKKYQVLMVIASSLDRVIAQILSMFSEEINPLQTLISDF